MEVLEGCLGTVTLRLALEGGTRWGERQDRLGVLGLMGDIYSHLLPGGESENGLMEDVLGMGGRRGTEDISTHARPGECPREGTGSGRSSPSASGHSQFMREENDNPAARGDDSADLKGTRFYVIDLGTEGPRGWRSEAGRRGRRTARPRYFLANRSESKTK